MIDDHDKVHRAVTAVCVCVTLQLYSNSPILSDQSMSCP